MVTNLRFFKKSQILSTKKAIRIDHGFENISKLSYL